MYKPIDERVLCCNHSYKEEVRYSQKGYGKVKKIITGKSFCNKCGKENEHEFPPEKIYKDGKLHRDSSHA